MERMEGKNDFPSKKMRMSRGAYAVFWRGNKFLVEGVEGTEGKPPFAPPPPITGQDEYTNKLAIFLSFFLQKYIFYKTEVQKNNIYNNTKSNINLTARFLVWTSHSLLIIQRHSLLVNNSETCFIAVAVMP